MRDQKKGRATAADRCTSAGPEKDNMIKTVQAKRRHFFREGRKLVDSLGVFVHSRGAVKRADLTGGKRG